MRKTIKKSRFIRVIVITMAVALFLCACQQTPEGPIVNAGDDTVLNDKIKATPIPTPEPPEDSDAPIETLSTIYNFPTEYKDEFKCVDEDISFNIDAQVIVPGVQAVPVVEIEPTIISPEFVKQFAEAMHPNVTLYEAKQVRLKSDIERDLLMYQEKASTPWSDFLKDYCESSGKDEDSAREYYEQCKAMVVEYKKLLETAPETYEQKPTDFSYHDLFGYYMFVDPELSYHQQQYGETVDAINAGRKFMMMTGLTEDSKYISIHVESRPDKDIESKLTYKLGTDLQIDSIIPETNPYWEAARVGAMTFGESEAAKLGNETIEKMGLADVMVLSGLTAYDIHRRPTSESGEKVYSYELEYHRGINGIIGSDVDIKNEYAYVAGNEVVKMVIKSDRVVEIEYENPYEITKVENENVGLISFEQAYDAFKKQARLEFTKISFNNEMDENGKPLDNVTRCDINIDKVELVMVRIPIKNGGYRYVPAWQFVGSFTRLKDYDGDERTEKVNDVILMTINAVDGTRIAGWNL